MTTEIADSPKRPRPGRLQLRPARFDDYDRLVGLEATLNPGTLPRDDWQKLWLSSPIWPRLESWWPIGWVLETATGELVGCMGNLPLLYHFRGETLLAAAGRAWLVLPEHRAFGSAARLLREHFHQPRVDFVVDTSVSMEAGDRGGHLTNRVPVGDWKSIAYLITNYPAFSQRALRKLRVPFARALAWPAALGLRLKDVAMGKRLRTRRSAYAVEQIDGFDSRFDAFWNELLRQKSDILLAARDRETLSWHFAAGIRKGRVWIFTASRDDRLRAYCIVARKDFPGELSRVRLIDYQTIEPEADLLRPLLAAAVQRCVTEGIAVFDKPAIGLPAMRLFDECAPYRRTQPWPFWYRPVPPALAEALRNPNVWEPSEYDGDASIG